MKQSNETIEVVVAWGSLLIGLIACLIFGWLLMRAVRRGKLGRLLAAFLHGVAIPVLGIAPLAIATGVRWLALLAGMPLFTRDGGNDGLLIGLGFMGIIVAAGAALLFAVVMLFQALTGFGGSNFADEE